MKKTLSLEVSIINKVDPDRMGCLRQYAIEHRERIQNNSWSLPRLRKEMEWKNASAMMNRRDIYAFLYRDAIKQEEDPKK